MLASILVWLVIGLVAGCLATLVVRGVDCGFVGNCAFGSLGALLGGLLSSTLRGGRSLAGFNLTGLLAACIGAFFLLRVSREIATRWRARHVERPPSATCEARGSCEAPGPREGIRGVRGVRGIQRMDLLLSRFSEDEIDRLSKLQLHYREQPHTFDQPLEERRLQFARWLVEHGRLNENVEPVKSERSWEEAEEPRHPNSGAKWPSGTSCRPLDGEPTPESACREPPEGWRAALLTSVSWLRQSIRTARASDRHSENPGCLPRESAPRNPYDRVGGISRLRGCGWASNTSPEVLRLSPWHRRRRTSGCALSAWLATRRSSPGVTKSRPLALIQPTLEVWAQQGGTGLLTYPAGSWGPPEAEEFLLRQGGRCTPE